MMEWVRGERLGYGSFATINLAIPSKSSHNFPNSLMAVKSSLVSSSDSLKNEKRILDEIEKSPHIITCFGDSFSIEKDGDQYYNLLLQYAEGGSLSDHLKNIGGKLSESAVKRYTSEILNGLKHIHANGFVHCDIKLTNILIFEKGNSKIADFGLAKKKGKNRVETGEPFEMRGTPVYMSPESVNENEYESPCDIWALGCAVLEMFTGKLPWDVKPDSNIYALMVRIGIGDELPELPDDLSNEAKDFLQKCFVKDPSNRWTAEMLLNHPFISGDEAITDTVTLKQTNREKTSVSPRGPFDFPEVISQPSLPYHNLFHEGLFCSSQFDSASAISRLRELVTEKPLDWSVSDSWVTVR